MNLVISPPVPPGTWRDLLHVNDDAAGPPLMIVTSRLADEYLWAEVLNLGGYDVLAKPFHEENVRHVVASAGETVEWRKTCGAG